MHLAVWEAKVHLHLAKVQMHLAVWEAERAGDGRAAGAAQTLQSVSC